MLRDDALTEGTDTLATRGTVELPESIIERRSGWQTIDVSELWRFRELFYSLVLRDMKVRYKQTLLGAGWAVFQPLMMMIAFTVFFGRMARMSSGSLPYPLFAMAGLIPWTFFSKAVGSASTSVVGSGGLITKIYFPRLLVPFSAVGVPVCDFIIAMGLLVAMMVYYGVVPGANLLLAPVIFGLMLIASVGIGAPLAALNVTYRDFQAMVPFLVQLWMFATPTVYMDTSNASPLILFLNPMAALIAAFRAALLGSPMPWGPLGAAAVFAVAVFLLGCFYYRRTEQSFADTI
jgi:lipopolysaccharide transport system permease protein